MNFRLLVVLLIAFFFTNDTRCQNIKVKIASVENGLVETQIHPNDLIKKHNLLERMRTLNVPSVSIAVINNGKIEWAKAYGYADLGEKRLANVKTIYQVASISKSINAFYIMKLVQESSL